MRPSDVDSDMSARPCEKGGTCEGVVKDSRYGKAVRCRKCDALHGYIRTDTKPDPKPSTRRK